MTRRYAISSLTAILVALISSCAVDDQLSVPQAQLATQSGCDPLLQSVCGLGSATLVNRHAPFYPTQAARNGVEGWVDLELRVDAAGNVLDVSIVASDPVGIFNEAAVEAAEHWRFASRLEAGEYLLTPRVVFDLVD